MRILLAAALVLVGLALLAGVPANAAARHGPDGGMNSSQARVQHDLNECARKYPSFDSLTKTYLGRDGHRHKC